MDLGLLPEFMFLVPADIPKCVWNSPIMMAGVMQDIWWIFAFLEKQLDATSGALGIWNDTKGFGKLYWALWLGIHLRLRLHMPMYTHLQVN